MAENDKGETYRSDIPADAVEGTVSPYSKKGGRISLEKRVYRVDGEIVGYRHYDKNGSLAVETPVRGGRPHGMKYYWDDGGGGPYLHVAEPYENGVVHGTARQWAPDGRLMGTYTLIHGTGYDLWRDINEHGQLYIAEVHAMKDGGPHGYERWVGEDQRTVWREVHWKDSQRHGIERQWDHEGNLDPGYPKFHIHDSIVDKESYLAAQRADPELPEYLAEDDKNERNFPKEIRMARHSD